MTALAIYIWMLGATLTLLGIGFVTLDAQGADLVALGALFMLAGLLAPILQGLYGNVREAWRRRAESNGGAGE